MKRKSLFFSLYTIDILENDIQIVATFDTLNDLQLFLGVHTSLLYRLGLKKDKGINIDITVDNIKYKIYVDKIEKGR